MTITDKSDSEKPQGVAVLIHLGLSRQIGANPRAQPKAAGARKNGVMSRIYNVLDMTASSNQAKCAKQSTHDNTVKALGRLEDYAKATK